VACPASLFPYARLLFRTSGWDAPSSFWDAGEGLRRTGMMQPKKQGRPLGKRDDGPRVPGRERPSNGRGAFRWHRGLDASAGTLVWTFTAVLPDGTMGLGGWPSRFQTQPLVGRQKAFCQGEGVPFKSLACRLEGLPVGAAGRIGGPFAGPLFEDGAGRSGVQAFLIGSSPVSSTEAARPAWRFPARPGLA
jgi:hypothetical protein